MTAITDSLFKPNLAIHANGDRHGFQPAHVKWNRNWWDDSEDRPIAGLRNLWYTDGHTPDFSTTPNSRRRIKTVGLLLEPPDIHPENYRAAEQALDEGHLDLLFTHQPEWFVNWHNAVPPYPLGGTMIHESDWRIWEKLPLVTAVASSKSGLPGHWLRHEVIAAFQGTEGFHAFGPRYKPVPLNAAGFYHKLPALQTAAYSLAIEPVDTGLVLSEHVLDCFLTGTVPIYWGPPDALRYWGFDELGVMRARRKEGLLLATELALASGMQGYEERRGAIERNFIRAHEFTSPEDWLWRNYPELFDE